MLAERGDPSEGPPFVTPSGVAMYHGYLWRLVRRLARRAGLPTADRITPHALRLAAVAAYLRTTNDVYAAQMFSGHARPETTVRDVPARRGLSDHGAFVLARLLGTRTGPDADGSGQSDRG